MADALSLDNLKSAGFNDTEIKDYIQTQVACMSKP